MEQSHSFLFMFTHRWQRDGGLGRRHPRAGDLPLAWGAAGRPSDPRAHQPDGCFPHRGPAGGRWGAPGQVQNSSRKPKQVSFPYRQTCMWNVIVTFELRNTSMKWVSGKTLSLGSLPSATRISYLLHFIQRTPILLLLILEWRHFIMMVTEKSNSSSQEIPFRGRDFA